MPANPLTVSLLKQMDFTIINVSMLMPQISQ